jgi:hypothetical protein
MLAALALGLAAPAEPGHSALLLCLTILKWFSLLFFSSMLCSESVPGIGY